MATKVSDYGAGRRARITSTALTESDLGLPAGKLAGGNIDVIRPYRIVIEQGPTYDTSGDQWDRNATSENQLFQWNVTAHFTTGVLANSNKDEDFRSLGHGYYRFSVALDYDDFVHDTTENYLDEIVDVVLNHLSTSGIPTRAGGTASPTLTVEDTPDPAS